MLGVMLKKHRWKRQRRRKRDKKNKSGKFYSAFVRHLNIFLFNTRKPMKS